MDFPNKVNRPHQAWNLNPDMQKIEPSPLRDEKDGEDAEATGSVIVDRFSLAEGGPTHQVQSWLGVAMPDRRKVITGAILAAIVAWLPLLILAALQGEAFGGVKIPLIYDVTVHVRFLISLPLLISAGLIIDPKVRRAVRHFVASGLITPQRRPAFEDLVRKTLKLRDAPIATVLLVVAAWGPSAWMNGGELLGSDTATWHQLASAPGDPLSLAGWWFTLVSVPLYRLWLFRWVWLTIVWTVFLVRISNFNLACIPTHPDKAAGLGFLAQTQVFFGWITFAAAAPVAARFASMISYEGQTVSGLKFLIMGTSLLTIVVAVAPLLVLSPRLFEIKERGLLEYGTLGTHYVQKFDAKWNAVEPPANEELLGTADLQSLADLSNSYAVLNDMRIVMINKETLFWVAVPAIAPMVILLLVETPVEDLIRTVLKLIA
jgi:hypothetical protein